MNGKVTGDNEFILFNIEDCFNGVNIMVDKYILQYMVGGLLYMPAFQDKIVRKVQENKIPGLTSVALCLEDAVQEDALEEAERRLASILWGLSSVYKAKSRQMPLLFVRVRTPEHMRHVSGFLGEAEDILTGYILPKFDMSNGSAYMEVLQEINERRDIPLYVMPVLESGMIADSSTRVLVLHEIKGILDSMKDYVLNVRVGGNDFSNLYGLRRPVHATIYSVGIVRDILMDILNVFARDYVVSGPVWEYFDDRKGFDWLDGLMEELELDRINGFIGKTAIHPSQLPHIFDSLKVSRRDYEDARQILLWDVDKLGVVKSTDGCRMNEVKTHRKWAERIKILGDIYGVKDEARERKNYGTGMVHGGRPAACGQASQ